ncbi:MAG: sodium:calcium antiporter [Acidimicrobiales bacterium]
MVHVVLLVGAAVAIYVACEWFINAVEWLGLELNVGRVAVGTILAAVGTALPESVVTLVAVAFGGSSRAKDIGVGAAMGGPLALSTIAYAVAGFVLLSVGRAGEPTQPGREQGRHRRRGAQVQADLSRLARDQRWFLAVFVVKVGLGLVAFAVKRWLGVLFFATYAVYFRREIGNREGSEGDGHELAPLRLQPRRARPSRAAVILQTAGTLGVIFAASQVFVHQLEWAGPKLGLSATVTALLLSPVATELPETLNAFLWVRQGKVDLALANISGAMMIQATVPSGLGILFTGWRFHAPLILSGAVTMAAIAYLLATMRAGRLTAGRLAATVGFYVVFAVGLVLLQG